jgi:hypothetical protein
MGVILDLGFAKSDEHGESPENFWLVNHESNAKFRLIRNSPYTSGACQLASAEQLIDLVKVLVFCGVPFLRSTGVDRIFEYLDRAGQDTKSRLPIFITPIF